MTTTSKRQRVRPAQQRNLQSPRCGGLIPGIVARIAAVLGIVLTGATAAALAASPLASAHVNAELDGGGPGEFGLITLRVPTESGNAATTKVEVRIPDNVQLRTVMAEPVAGWTIDITKRTIAPIYKDDGTPVTEVVSSVTWTATGGDGIEPGQFGRFTLDVGPLPDAPTLAVPTVQTFSDGTVKEWIQPASADKPKFPAPTVTIGSKPAAANSTSTLGAVVSWTALGFSVIAVGLGVFAIDRAAARRSKSPTTAVASALPSESPND